MAGVDLGSIVAHLRLEMNDFNSGLNDAVNRIRETQQQFEGLSSFGKSLSTVGAGLTASITAPVMALGASVVKTQMHIIRKKRITLIILDYRRYVLVVICNY